MRESEFERRFLEFVYRTDIAITPSALAYYAEIPIAEADEHLKKLITKDVVKMDFSANGDLVYTFPNRQIIGPPVAGMGSHAPHERPIGIVPRPSRLESIHGHAMPVIQVGGQVGGHGGGHGGAQSGSTALAMLPQKAQPAPGEDTIACPYCGETILVVAKKCKHCNEILDPTLRMAIQPMQVNVGIQNVPHHYMQRHNRQSQGVAALLSFFWPGAGHIYCGEVGAGIGWMMATFIGYLAFIIPGIILHICCIVAASNTAKSMT
jgi:hypothetical protein